MNIAAQLYTIRDRMRDAGERNAALHALRGIGYTAVEVAGVDQAAGERFTEELRAAGLIACAAHVALEELTADLDTVATRCRGWGCAYVVVPSLPAAYHSASGVERFVALATQMAPALKTHSLKLAYHNHAFELERWDGLRGLDLLYAAPPGVLQAELDTYWLQHAGASPAAWIGRLAERVPLVHLKDMAIRDGRQVQAEVGEGNLDWPAILGACREAGTEWLVVEQDECAGDPLASLEISYRNLTDLLAAGRPASAK